MGYAQTRMYRRGVLKAEGFPLADVSEHLAHPDTIVWVDLRAPEARQLDELALELGLHELALSAWKPADELVAGGVCSRVLLTVEPMTPIVEVAKAMIDAGKARSLAVMAPARNSAFADVPTMKEAAGIDYSVGAWRGIAGPKGMPADVASKLTAALKKAYDSKEFKDFMGSRGFGMASDHELADRYGLEDVFRSAAEPAAGRKSGAVRLNGATSCGSR